MQDVAIKMFYRKCFPQFYFIMRIHTCPCCHGTIEQTDLTVGIPKPMTNKPAAVIRTTIHPVSPVRKCFLRFKNRPGQSLIERLISIETEDIIVCSEFDCGIFLTDIAPEFLLVNFCAQASRYFHGSIGRE